LTEHISGLALHQSGGEVGLEGDEGFYEFAVADGSLRRGVLGVTVSCENVVKTVHTPGINRPKGLALKILQKTRK
jgi:hypothetical protein